MVIMHKRQILYTCWLRMPSCVLILENEHTYDPNARYIHYNNISQYNLLKYVSRIHSKANVQTKGHKCVGPNSACGGSNF